MNSSVINLDLKQLTAIMWVFYCAVAALFFWSFSFPTSAVLNTQSIFPTFSVLQVALVGITRRLEVRNRTVRISIKLTLVLVHYFHTVQIIFTQNFSFSCIIYLSHTKILFQLTHMLWVTSPLFCLSYTVQGSHSTANGGSPRNKAESAD